MNELCEQTSERRSKWPNTLCIDFIVILPTVREGPMIEVVLVSELVA